VLPQAFVGIKPAAVNSTVGATIAKWIGSDAGLGFYIQKAVGQYSVVRFRAVRISERPST
jgi:ABC-type nitrate/sulfonate/bicarbonate transport system permease component